MDNLKPFGDNTRRSTPVNFEKTLESVDTWFTESVKQELAKVPPLIIQSVKEKPEYMQILTEAIARKLCFREKPVKELLITLIT